MSFLTDLQGYWKLNGNANDVTGSFNGSAVGTVTWPAGQFDDCAAMAGAGAGNYVSTPTSAVDVRGGFTISLWANNTAGWGVSGYNVLAGKDGANGFREFLFYLDPAAGGKVGIALYELDGAHRIARTGPFAIADGTWFHVVCTYDGGTLSSGIKVYLNGVQVDNTSDDLGVFTSVTAPSRNFVLGQAEAPWNLSFNGEEDDAALWTRVLSAAEVLAIYTAGAAGNSLETLLNSWGVGLEAYYPMDGNVTDYTGAYPGTIANTVTFSAGQFGDAADMVGTAPAPYIGNFIHSAMNALSFAGGFTYSGWINSTAGTPGINPYGVQSIANKDGVNGTREWAIYIVGTVLGVACYTGDGASRISRTAPVPATGAFHHILVTYDGGLLSSGLKIYVGGVQVDNLDDNLGAYTGMTAPTNYLRLGQYVGSPPMPGGAGEHLRFSGSMDDVAIWTRTLSAAEALAIYTAGAAGSPLSALLSSQVPALFGSVVHDIADFSQEFSLFGSVVHDVTDFSKTFKLFGSVVHAGAPPPSAVCPNIAGIVTLPATPATFDGSASTSVSYYNWAWVSVPGGSAIAVGAVPFPDNGAVTPIDMTSNVALYHCEEVAGTTGTDTSGSTNNAALTTITVGQPGKVGSYAWQFTGAGSVAQPAVAIPTPGDQTISFWFKGLAPSATWRTGIRGSSWYQIIVESGTDRLGLYAGGFWASGATLTVGGDWRHIATVATGGDTLFYVDGALVGTVVGKQSSDTIAYIGNFSGQRFADYLDEFAVWNRALSAAEIANIYALQTGVVGTASTYAFMPDVVGTYTINLEVAAGVDVDADAVITAPSAGGITIQGEAMQGGSLQGRSTQGFS